MLARLDQIDGVESSYANGSGTLIRLSLRPGADLRKVTGAARRVLSEEVVGLVPVQLAGGAAARALRQEEWRDKSRVAELAALEMATPAARAPTLLAVLLLLACAALGVGLLWWRQRGRLAGKHKEAV